MFFWSCIQCLLCFPVFPPVFNTCVLMFLQFSMQFSLCSTICNPCQEGNTAWEGKVQDTNEMRINMMMMIMLLSKSNGNDDDESG